MRRDSALRKMDSLVKVYDNLVKHKPKQSESFREKEEHFKEAIANEIMDIAHSQAKLMMENQEDICFLEMQREDPKSCSMGSVDMKLHHKEMNKRIRLAKIEEYKEKARKEQEATDEKVPLESASSSGSNSDIGDPTFEYSASSSKKNTSTKKRPRNMMSQDLAATYDRLNVSYRNAAMAYLETAK